jgi:hypothetical protein
MQRAGYGDDCEIRHDSATGRVADLMVSPNEKIVLKLVTCEMLTGYLLVSVNSAGAAHPALPWPLTHRSLVLDTIIEVSNRNA